VTDPAPRTDHPTTALDLERHRDLRGRTGHPWIRRAILMVMAALVLVALTGRLGQSDHVTTVRTATARIDLRSPSALRGGLLWPARITVRARTRIVDPQLILGAGYVEGMQLNTIEPAAADETSRGDSLALTYATLDAGDQLTVYLQLQVNPDTLGRQDLSVVLRGGGEHPPPPVRLRASTTVLP
jgi:hypothetical protein